MDRLSMCAKLVEAEKNKDTFVRNRVLEINDKDITFHHINTKHNPADLPTRVANR